MAGVREVPTHVVAVRARVDVALARFLDGVRDELVAIAPAATEPLDEVGRLLDAGGKRLRPLFCYWGYRAGGGVDLGTENAPIVQAAAAFELLHTMALIHDDVIDGSPERRGRPSVHAHRSEAAALRGDPDPVATGRAVAIVAGDLAAVLADRLLLESGVEPAPLADALAYYHRMRISMAAGQHLSLLGDARTDPGLVASLKGGSYTVVGPLHVGAALAGASTSEHEALEAIGEPLGEAFQLLDDLRDGDASPAAARISALVGASAMALDRAGFDDETTTSLRSLIDLVAAS